MIPAQNIIAWGNNVPWAEQRQVEQDLDHKPCHRCHFSDPLLGAELRFRGRGGAQQAAFRGANALLRRPRPCPHHERSNRPYLTAPWGVGTMAGARAVRPEPGRPRSVSTRRTSQRRPRSASRSKSTREKSRRSIRRAPYTFASKTRGLREQSMYRPSLGRRCLLRNCGRFSSVTRVATCSTSPMRSSASLKGLTPRGSSPALAPILNNQDRR